MATCVYERMQPSKQRHHSQTCACRLACLRWLLRILCKTDTRPSTSLREKGVSKLISRGEGPLSFTKRAQSAFTETATALEERPSLNLVLEPLCLFCLFSTLASDLLDVLDNPLLFFLDLRDKWRLPVFALLASRRGQLPAPLSFALRDGKVERDVGWRQQRRVGLEQLFNLALRDIRKGRVQMLQSVINKAASFERLPARR